MPRFLRYLAPNLVTSTGLLFGLLSLVATSDGRFVDAGWLITWAVMLDRMDGLVARTFKATSPFGVQMDSFADAINFGVAPAFLVYTMLSAVPALGFEDGFGRALLLGACAIWVIATVFRLAKFNVVAESESVRQGPLAEQSFLVTAVLGNRQAARASRPDGVRVERMTNGS